MTGKIHFDKTHWIGRISFGEKKNQYFEINVIDICKLIYNKNVLFIFNNSYRTDICYAFKGTANNVMFILYNPPSISQTLTDSWRTHWFFLIFQSNEIMQFINACVITEFP